MVIMAMVSIKLRDKHIRKLVAALEGAGLEVSVTPGKKHIRVRNPDTGKIVFFGSQSLGDFRAGKNIKRDLKMVGFDLSKHGIKLG